MIFILFRSSEFSLDIQLSFVVFLLKLNDFLSGMDLVGGARGLGPPLAQMFFFFLIGIFQSYFFSRLSQISRSLPTPAYIYSSILHHKKPMSHNPLILRTNRLLLELFLLEVVVHMAISLCTLVLGLSLGEDSKIQPNQE